MVNNAGYSLGDTEDGDGGRDAPEDRDPFLWHGPGTQTRAIEAMRQAKDDHRGGVIFNISSLAGLCAFPGHAYYHAGKFAVEGFSESVAREMHPDWTVSPHIMRTK